MNYTNIIILILIIIIILQLWNQDIYEGMWDPFDEIKKIEKTMNSLMQLIIHIPDIIEFFLFRAVDIFTHVTEWKEDYNCAVKTFDNIGKGLKFYLSDHIFLLLTSIFGLVTFITWNFTCFIMTIVLGLITSESFLYPDEPIKNYILYPLDTSILFLKNKYYLTKYYIFKMYNDYLIYSSASCLVY